jgi:hypothetical protein
MDARASTSAGEHEPNQVVSRSKAIAWSRDILSEIVGTVVIETRFLTVTGRTRWTL